VPVVLIQVLNGWGACTSRAPWAQQ